MAISKLELAARVIDDDPDKTNELCIKLLDEDPDNAKALFLMGTVLLRAEKNGLAANIFQRVTQLAPNQAGAWNNLGMAYEGALKYPEARKCFEKAVAKDPTTLDYRSNIAMVAMQEGKYQEAMRMSRQILKDHPDHPGANMTNGFSSLALCDWEPGWKGYEYTLGGKYRKESQYQAEGRWDGGEDHTLVVYGEQGLGDEIMYASCVPDVSVNELIVECDKRLEGLFRRSFPHAHVYGTRRDEELPWLDAHQITARCPIAGLPRFYRNRDADFTGKPYLVADPERRLQWRALFDSMGKRPKIGISWSGGRHNTGAKRREVGLEAFRPLITGLDADFISLQYKDPTDEIKASGLPVKHYKRAAESNDYDDMAGMVAELDLVIGVHTTALHLSGALGVKTIALVPSKPMWLYYPDKMHWYGNYTFHKQKDGERWDACVARLAEEMK